MSSQYFGINANRVRVGENSGQPHIYSSNSDRILGQIDLVDKNRLDVITYDETAGVIDFHNKTIQNFSGGGSGSGDAVLANNQTFTGINTFSANSVFSTMDTGNINTIGTINATSAISGSKVEVTGNLECNTGTLECNDCEITNDCTIATGNLEVTAGTTSVNAISTNNITTTGTITCNSSIAGASLAAQAGDITAVSGNISGLSLQSTGGQVNLKTGNARIESDVNDDTRIQANTNTDTIVFRLGATGADNLQLSYDSGTNKSVLRLYDFGASPPQYYNVGGSPDDLAGLIATIQNTSLTFNGSTTGTFEGSLVSTGTTTLSGTTINLGTGVNVTTITCMNDSNDALNINGGVVTLDATATLAKTGTTSGATDLFTSTDTILDRSALSFTPTLFTLVSTTPTTGQIQLAGSVINSVQASIQAVRYGTNSGTPVYRVSCRGRLTGFSVNNIGSGSGSIDLFTLPAGYRPTIEQNIISQGHPDEGQIRIDISTSGLVSIAEGASTNLASFCNLGTIDIWAGI